ncbi:hypothetical protein CW680_00815 [Candidatus Bathyarchaeota archaeon]|nr:MAG: hypothetical protein CW680_00815 [Candidatus Bathyarchaeota archaeon]
MECINVETASKAYATIRISLPSERESAIIYKALKPETESSPTPRSKVNIDKDGKTLTLTFKASDTTALRAAVNSYLRWIMLLDDTYSKIENVRRG